MFFLNNLLWSLTLQTQMVPYQACLSHRMWFPIPVSSSSDDMTYVVWVSPWGKMQENICECKGYLYRSHCRHQEKAQELLCDWSELSGTEQTDLERKSKICPACAGPTRWEVEVIEG